MYRGTGRWSVGNKLGKYIHGYSFIQSQVRPSPPSLTILFFREGRVWLFQPNPIWRKETQFLRRLFAKKFHLNSYTKMTRSLHITHLPLILQFILSFWNIAVYLRCYFDYFLQCIAINDINPQAPTHVLIVPKKPIVQLSKADDEDEQVR